MTLAGVSVTEGLSAYGSSLTDEQRLALEILEQHFRMEYGAREDDARDAMAGRRDKALMRGVDKNTGRPHPNTVEQQKQSKRRAAGIQEDEDRVAEAVAARIVATPLALDKIDGGYALNFNELVTSAHVEVFEEFRKQWSEDPDRGDAYAKLVCNRVVYPGHLIGPLTRLLEQQERQKRQEEGGRAKRPARSPKSTPEQPRRGIIVADALTQRLTGQTPEIWTGAKYDGKPHTVKTDNKTGASIDVTLTVDYQKDYPELAERVQKSIDLAKSLMTADDGFWLDAIATLATANEDRYQYTDLDVLAAVGYRNPAQKGCDEARKEAFDCIRALTRIRILVDTTADARRRGAKGRTWEITESAIIEGRWRVFGSEDGSTGWELVLKPIDEGAPALAALPLAMRAKQTNQTIPFDPAVFEFPFAYCGNVQLRHRKMMRYIYKHTRARGIKHPEIVRFDTMFEKLGIEVGPNTIRNTMSALRGPLDWWARPDVGVIAGFRFRPAGRSFDAIEIDLLKPKKALEDPHTDTHRTRP